MISGHKSDLNHEFKWNEITILNEFYFNKRLISEMYVKRQRNNLNLQTDNKRKVYLCFCDRQAIERDRRECLYTTRFI